MSYPLRSYLRSEYLSPAHLHLLTADKLLNAPVYDFTCKYYSTAYVGLRYCFRDYFRHVYATMRSRISYEEV